MTAGRGATEVHWMLRPGACDVQHCQPAARGLLSFLSLLRAFWLNVIKRNGACDVEHFKPSAHGLLSFLSLLRAFLLNIITRNQAIFASHFRGRLDL